MLGRATRENKIRDAFSKNSIRGSFMAEDSAIRSLWDVRVPMRDGVSLSADIHLPLEDTETQYPAILWRTPYDNARKLGHYSPVDSAKFFASNEYAFVIQDVRGRCDSDGVWDPFFNEGPDGYDTIEWIAEQSWCNGKIGMMGGSYAAWVQWAAAREKPPHLMTMVSAAAGGFFMKEIPFFNGIPFLAFMLPWLHFVGGRTLQMDVTSVVDWKKVLYHLPLNNMDEMLGRKNTVWKEWLSHPSLDDYWKRMLFNKEDFKRIEVPTLHITGWYDGDQPGALFFYEGMVKHSPTCDRQYIIIGPWDHGGTRTPRQHVGGVDFTIAALMDMNKVHLDWFDYWLKGKENDVSKWERVKFFVMGVNKWAVEDGTWPPRDIKRIRYYLHGQGRANTLMGDGELSPDEPREEPPDNYKYNPEEPVLPVIDLDFYGGEAVETPLDNRFILRRDDVLVYTSKLLEKKIMIAGRPILELYASSDCLDTDWFATLADVHPDGKSIPLGGLCMGLCGALRSRYRNSLEKPELLSPKKVYTFTLELPSTCIVFKPRHRIRLAITSSAFPIYARNQNTGKNIAHDSEMKIANNKVYHDKNSPSHILLPTR